MNIVITGGDGFIAQNLRVRLRELGHTSVGSVTRRYDDDALQSALAGAEFVFHLAGVNRPPDISHFERDNVGLTAKICGMLQASGRSVPIVYSSSTQAALDNPYGRSKRAAELVVESYGAASGAPVFIYRFTNVFGKWCRPNYNSVVATFCHNIARKLPIMVTDATAPLRLLYVDDAVDAMVACLDSTNHRPGFVSTGPVYESTVGGVAAMLTEFANSRITLTIPGVGAGFTRALYSTYVSYLPPSEFDYGLRRHADPRGVFVEMLKTPEHGQFSYFTALPGVTRGEHYHHSKTEKFLVVKGRARFGFRHLVNDDRHEIVVDAAAARVVETVPGWIHDVTNVGEDEMIVLLWANEVFDPQRPDTIAAKVQP